MAEDKSKKKGEDRPKEAARKRSLRGREQKSQAADARLDQANREVKDAKDSGDRDRIVRAQQQQGYAQSIADLGRRKVEEKKAPKT